VPLDGSELAEVVFAYAKEIAGRLDLEVTLLHVCGPEERERLPMYRAYVERAAEIIKRHSKEVQERTGIQPGGRLAGARGELVAGHPAEEILHFADENDIDLILMATHGRSGIRRWAMGSVADKVLRASEVPVLLVRAGIPEESTYDEWPRRTILVPLDGSELAESVLPHVEALAKRRGAEPVDVALISVCEPPAISFAYSEAMMPLDWDKRVEQEKAICKRASRRYLSRIEKQLKDVGLRVRSDVLVGHPAEEILRFADENHVDLILMSTHGRSGIRRWARGSVAEKVLVGVSSPILMVRPH